MSQTATPQPTLEQAVVKSATPMQLALKRFRKSRAGVIGFWILVVLYTIALFAGFLAPYNITEQHYQFQAQPPQRVHLIHDGQLRWPFVYRRSRSLETP